MRSDRRIVVRTDGDVVAARQQGRVLAAELGFSATDATLVATAISEVARNIISYARTGEIRIGIVTGNDRHGIRVVATDAGPGIDDLDKALQDGFSTGQGMGLGLPGTRRLMDEFDIRSAAGEGTTVTMTKWGARR